MYHDGVLHHRCDIPANSPIPAGQYTLVVRFEAVQDSMPSAGRVAMPPVEVTMPVTIK
jgi:hypothetical protein